MAQYRLGDRGSVVAEIRVMLVAQGLLENAAPEAEFDLATDHAVRMFQQNCGLIVDGVVGPATYSVLREASYSLGTRVLAYRMSEPMRGDDVVGLQCRLATLGYYTGLVDGQFGPVTHTALCAYQGEFGVTADGICGPETHRSLQRIGARVTGGAPHVATRDEQTVRASARLAGTRIVIDPGFGVPDEFVDAATADLETRILWDLAQLVEGRMAAAGMETVPTRSVGDNPDAAARALAANSCDAHLVIALRCGRYKNANAHGTASFYFGHAHGSASTTGRSLSGFIQSEIVARTGLRDCGSHQRAWDILRLPRMPAVQIDVGHITNPGDAAALADPQTRDLMADAILVAVKRLYLLGGEGNSPPPR